MAIEGYEDYKRREYCKDIRCPVQIELEAQAPGSEAYEKVRDRCKNACIHTTYEFHHWLIEHGYLVVRMKAEG
ncbi:hypothetical protein JW916_08560 [Candidatus Sumerlaeota bacterium]|nr:hypothetical protein [Candidatus Sumerlaeota bacterium]